MRSVFVPFLTILENRFERLMYEKVCRTQDFLVNLYRTSSMSSVTSIATNVSLEEIQSIASMIDVPNMPGGPMIRITDWSGTMVMYV